jgi:hypothetical protein
MSLAFNNNVAATLTAAAAPTDNTIYVSPADAAKFPDAATTTKTQFYATITNAGQRLAYEVVLCSLINKATGEMVVTRGADDTTAKSWQAGDQILMLQNAGAMSAMLQIVDFQNGKYSGGMATSTAADTIILDMPGKWDPANSGSTYAFVFISPITNTGSVTATLRIGGVEIASGLAVRTETNENLIAGDISENWPMSFCYMSKPGAGVPLILLNPRASRTPPTPAVQTYHNVSGSRSFGVDYQNTTAQTIEVSVALAGEGAASADLSVDGVRVAAMGTGSAVIGTLQARVNPGQSYKVNTTGAITVNCWVEYS